MSKPLSELREEKHKHCSFDDIFKIKEGEPTEEQRKDIDDYLYDFAIPDGRCLACGVELTGLFGRFKYGIVHGEGQCSNCGWPIRRDHYNVSVFESFQLMLQYHPDSVEEKED